MLETKKVFVGYADALNVPQKMVKMAEYLKYFLATSPLSTEVVLYHASTVHFFKLSKITFNRA